MKKIFLTFVGILFFASPTFSAGYGEGGCGLGSLIFGDSPGFVQVFAATTNQTLRNQAFGISSGTSNCDSEGFDLAKREQEMFFAQNYNDLVKEMAAGDGENLSTLSSLLGCPTESDHKFASFTRDHFEIIYANNESTPGQMLEAIRFGISNDPELSAACIT